MQSKFQKSDGFERKIGYKKVRVGGQTLKDLESKFTYVPKNTSSGNDALKDYESLGEQLRSSPCTILTEMKELTARTYKKQYIETSEVSVAPSFIVCSSSGTGKTQLPFTLDIPLLYFTLSTEDQSIYGSFVKISNHFCKLLKYDFLKFCEQKLNVAVTKKNSSDIQSEGSENFLPVPKSKDQEKYSLDKFTVDTLNTSLHSLRAPSFLVALFEEIFKLKKENADSAFNWPRLQLMVKEAIYPEEMDIGAAAVKIKDIFRKNTKDNYKLILPLIFLDEFNVSPESTPEEKAQFAFYRNLIRACGLIPVIMGTNSHITNMITAGKSSGKETLIWAYIFYALPNCPETFLRKRLNENISIYQEFLDLIFELLCKERPLFVFPVLEKLQNFELTKNSSPDEFAAVFDEMLKAIQSKFIERKEGYMNTFFRGQIVFFENSYQLEHYKSQEHVDSRFIHSHLAFLQIQIVPTFRKNR